MFNMVLLRYVVWVCVGLLGGWAYWYFVGCESGTCAITSSPVNSSAYGALLGFFAAGTMGKQGPKPQSPS